MINRANDRHGELENETAAISWLFNNRETHMRNLAKDIVKSKGIYEPPLVFPTGDKYTVYDGNRRTTCLKLIINPRRAPTAELQVFFQKLKDSWSGELPNKIPCQVEQDRDRIDEILFRRHTGSQNGVGQSMWDDRMKSHFVTRTGKCTGINIADQIETHLKEAKMLPAQRIPRSNLNRLLSAEAFRNRLGISVSQGEFKFIRKKEASLRAMARVARDLAEKKVVLEDIWDVEAKTRYLDSLDQEGILPTAKDAIEKPEVKAVASSSSKPLKRFSAPRPKKRTTLIPDTDYGITWPGHLQRHRDIWEELQHQLFLETHPNAISTLFRVLLELSIENYLARTTLKNVYDNDKLANKLIKVADDLCKRGQIDKKYLSELKKMQQAEKIISIDTLHRYVHSPDFAPSPEHLRAIWDSLAKFLALCLKA
ncbi:hypothetical protein [Iodidimonas muriae]|uniref:hypothetical protein n=1 Tax=Iodidimonas muriae TaxID=261467 RepID=UPI001E339EF8|nr:hypothetical protein [Iodidimonas muriae]